MRLDIPDDLPRRRTEDVNAAGSDENTVIRKLPDSPILHRLKSLVERVADYRWTRRFDTYAGVSYSAASNGLASGFLYKNDWAPMIGGRFNF